VLAATSSAVSEDLISALKAYTENQRHLLEYLRKVGSQAPAPVSGQRVVVVTPHPAPRVGEVSPPRLHTNREYDYFVDLERSIAAAHASGG
jgi:hypothetical protein